MPRTATADDIVAAVSSLPSGRTSFVGIDGPGGAGKSTLAARLAGQLSSFGQVDVVHVDDFSGPWFAEWDWARFREQVLTPLLAGQTARYQCWDWISDRGADWLEVLPGGVVIVEGVSATRKECAVPWTLTVWVDAPPEVRRARAVARDGEDMWPTWRDRWIPSEKAYIRRERPQRRVDFLVSGAG